MKLVKQWWRDERPDAPDWFDDDLASAIKLLSVTPRMGGIFRTKDGVTTYRLLLRRTQQHVYYFVDDDTARWSSSLCGEHSEVADRSCRTFSPQPLPSAAIVLSQR